jgi:DNA adenine methylase
LDSFISWIGGKKLLRDQIISRFPSEFGRYIEVFGGAAWVLFRRDKHADFEVYNDFDGSLVNLFRCVQHHADELQRELAWTLNSREVFEDFRVQHDMRGLTDIQRAARFWALIKFSYGSDRRSYGCSKKRANDSLDRLKEVQARLDGVVVEHRDFEQLIKVYDRPDALFYLDPPYVGTEDYYEDGFTADDHDRLYAILKGIKGCFILSYNDDPRIRELYKDFKIDAIDRANNLALRYADKANKQYGELIISNF